MVGAIFRPILKGIFGTSAERQIRKLLPILEQVRACEWRYTAMSNLELRGQTSLFKERLEQGATLDDILPEAFSVCREAAKRVIGLRPFDVQVIGGTVLHQGAIAEMVTGEGKTLVATLPVYLNALEGKGVHLVTVNDYLARRDKEWMAPIYEFLGLTVGLVLTGMQDSERQVGYRADITYGTNSEFGFDYLRDNMKLRSEDCAQRGLNYAIVDEIDSILIDEARTPLIISGRPEKSTDLYYKVDEAVRRLRSDTHFELEEKGRVVMFTEEGMAAAETLMGVENLFTGDTLGLVHMLEQALRAHHFYRRDDEYVVKNSQVIIVDENTGRLMEGRRYSDGLHQALEAKERVAVQFETQTIASVSYQNYFLLYKKIAGMTGTAMTEAMEFANIYNLEVYQIPTNLPLIRDDQPDLIFSTESGKFKKVVDEILEVHETGRPVLVGTVSIEKSELVAKMLDERGVKEFQVLNAKHHEKEASIVGHAGKRATITIATNMAGRGTDIKLGDGVRELGGLSIIGTERHESRRIDNQLRGRCGRQGDPGATQFFLSLEDEVARLFGGDKVKKIIDWLGSDQMDDEPLSQRMVTNAIERAQRRVEEYNFEARKHLKEYDDVMNKQRQVIYGMRKEVLLDKDITERLHTMFENIVGDMIDQYAPQDDMPDDWDLDGLETRFKQVFHFDPSLEYEGDEARPLIDDLMTQVLNEYKRREVIIAEELHAINREQIGAQADSIDFHRVARRKLHHLEVTALLKTVDDKWIDHLYSMDYLRDSVRLRAYGQKDPLIEYKTEGFELFELLLKNIEESVIQILFRQTDPAVFKAMRQPARPSGVQTDSQVHMSELQYVSSDKQQDRSFAAYDTSKFALAGQHGAPPQGAGGNGESGDQPQQKRVPVRATVRVSPNDPCPCGSGKKFKKCCGAQREL